MTSTTSSPPLRKLKVFQASPLTYKDQGRDIPCPLMDLEKEEEILKEALGDTNIELTFEIATVTAFSTFLAQGNRFLHLSCHGRPSELFIEDGYGGCHILVVGDTLQQWIAAGRQRLQFVFVSACHSRSVGEAFINAGVPYVICCEQDGHQLLDQAARVFAKAFYNAVAKGTQISFQEAFDIAIGTVIQSPEIQQVAGITPETEAKKFVLLTKTGASKNLNIPPAETTPAHEEDSINGSERSLSASFNSQNHPTGSQETTESSMSMLRLPVPPELFLDRELVMHGILRALFKNRKTVRLVRVVGEKGIGKVSLAKAIARYIKKRNMWGHVLWLPMANSTDKVSPDSMFKAIVQVDEFYKEKALLIIDTAQFSETSMASLCSFLDTVFEMTQYVKVIVIQSTGAAIASVKNIRGFPCEEKKVLLKPLSFEAAVYLFCHSCGHARNWYQPYNTLLKMKSDTNVWNVWKILGEGNPAKILSMAKTITHAEFTKLTKGVGPINIDDFEQRLNDVEKMSIVNNHNNQEVKSSPQITESELQKIVSSDLSAKTPDSPLRTQEEIIARFVPMLRNGLVYRKTAPAFIRKASKGEHIVTVINGILATECTVEDDTSWVVCGRVANEYYPITDEKFKAIYDTEHPEDLSQTHHFFHDKGFKAYRSIRQMFAHAVDEEDMAFFRHGNAAATTKEAYFMAPWGSPNRIELGDYLVLQCPDGKDDIYRIERSLFEGSYTDTKRGSIQEGDDLGARTAALEERMAKYREQNPAFAELDADIRQHFAELMASTKGKLA